jgi:hypothetical protein
MLWRLTPFEAKITKMTNKRFDEADQKKTAAQGDKYMIGSRYIHTLLCKTWNEHIQGILYTI